MVSPKQDAVIFKKAIKKLLHNVIENVLGSATQNMPKTPKN